MSNPHHFTEKKRSLLIVSGLSFIAIVLLLKPDSFTHPIINGPLTLYYSELPSTIILGQSFPLELRVKTGSEPINAAQVKLKYDPRILDISKMNTSQSFCSFYADNSFDTIVGEVKLACGTPNPGFTGDSVLIHLTMRAKTTGTSSLTLDPKETEVLANDGKGTNLLKSVPNASITVKNSF